MFIGGNTVGVNGRYFKIGRYWKSLLNWFTQISNLFQKLEISHNTPGGTCERPENKKLMGFQEILIFYLLKSTRYKYASSWQFICNCQRIYIFLDSSFMNFAMNFMKYGQLLTSLPFTFEKSILKQISLVGVHTLSVTVT